MFFYYLSLLQLPVFLCSISSSFPVLPVVITAAFAEGFYVTIWCLAQEMLWILRTTSCCHDHFKSNSRAMERHLVTEGVPRQLWRAPCQARRKASRKLRACLSCIVHCTAETSATFFPEYCVSVVELGVKTFCRPCYVQRGKQIEKCVACHPDQWYTCSLLGFLCDCKRRGGRRRKAHTADDVIDQHVN